MEGEADKVLNDPGNESLRQQVMAYERVARPRELRRMRQEGTPEEYVRLKVEAARSHACYLIDANIMPTEAWRRAIRMYILEQELD